MTPHDFLTAKMQLAARYEYRETSGYRAAMPNAAAGGVHFSAHLFWLGVDVILVHPEETTEFIEAARRVGLRVLDEGDHLHLQPLTWEKG